MISVSICRLTCQMTVHVPFSHTCLRTGILTVQFFHKPKNIFTQTLIWGCLLEINILTQHFVNRLLAMLIT